jgi:mannose-6-phosphate isomerase-like protein (cupin superfamily)
LIEVEKVWGTERWIENGAYCIKYLDVLPGYRCSLHFHPVKKETFIVQSGIVRLEQRDVRGHDIDEMLIEGDYRTIEPKTPHRFSSHTGATILEVSTHHDDLDVIRLTESGKISDANSQGTSRLPK